MNTKKALEILEFEGFEIKQATLFKYENDFKLNVPRDETGARVYNDAVLEKIKEIIKLREQDNGINTIQRKIGVHKPSIEDEEKVYKGVNEPRPENEISSKIEALEEKIEITFGNVLEEVKKEYFTMGNKLGMLEAELRAERKEKERIIEEAEKEKRRLYEGSMNSVSTLNKDLQRRDKELEMKNSEIEEMKEKLSQLEKENKTLVNEKLKPWYKKLFGS